MEEFLSDAMDGRVLFQGGTAQRLSLLDGPLGGYDLRYLLAHGDESTIWRSGGLETTRGTDSDRDAEALSPGTTIQTHLQRKLAFGRRFVLRVARQMQLERGYFSIFASRESHTVAHYDRNYNFTIQLRGEKTWEVHSGKPAVQHPSGNLSVGSDHLATMPPHMHGESHHETNNRASTYHLRPGDMLYVPPGFCHATSCAGDSTSLNVSIEPNAWFHVVGGALMRHLEGQPVWRAPFGVPTRSQAEAYVERLKGMVNALTPDDLVGSSVAPDEVRAEDLLRRTMGSLLMWEKHGAGVHFGTNELRFVAKGRGGRLLDTLTNDWEQALGLVAHLDQPKTFAQLSAEAGVDLQRMRDFVTQLLRVGYLVVVAAPTAPGSPRPDPS
ncbi:MAG: cupin domain-containing protein [Polyangia bacterium]